MNKLATNKDFVGGVMLMALAAFFFTFGWRLRVGAPSQMGPGFIPMGISGLLALIGVTKVVVSFRTSSEDDAPSAKLRPLLVVAAAPIVFGLLIGPMGIVVTVAAVSIFCRFAMHQRLVLSDLVIGLALSAFCALVFVVLLGQAIDLWPRWI
jgi:Tripartite tricarboxylate transporter TctB family